MTSYFISGATVRSDIISDVNALNWTVPIVPNPADPNAWFSSRIRNAASLFTADELLITQPVAMNRHPWGILPATFNANANLRAFFGAYLTQTPDADGKAFVSSLEAVQFPIYCIAFHPEKTVWEWRQDLVTPHNDNSTRANLWQGFLLASEARKNNVSFPTPAAEAAALIYAYAGGLHYTFDIIPEFIESYVFNFSEVSRTVTVPRDFRRDQA